jgi:hypothetical protein
MSGLSTICVYTASITTWKIASSIRSSSIWLRSIIMANGEDVKRIGVVEGFFYRATVGLGII